MPMSGFSTGTVISFDPDEPVAVLWVSELFPDPWPIKFPMSRKTDPGIDELQDFRIDWQDIFVEDH